MLRATLYSFAPALLVALAACSSDQGQASGGAGGHTTAASSSSGSSASSSSAGGAGGSGGAPNPWHANVRVSRQGDEAFEPAIAVDTKGHVCVAYMLLTNNGSSVVIAASSDGGATFAYPFEDSNPKGFAGDVSVAAGNDGHFYFAWIDYDIGMMGVDGGRVMLATSDDAGATWKTPVVVYQIDPGMGRYVDRPWVAVGDDGTVSVLFSDVDSMVETNFVTHLSRSIDHGTMFKDIAVSSTVPMNAYQLVSFGASDISNTTLLPYVAIDPTSFIAEQVGVLSIAHGSDTVTDPMPIAITANVQDKAYPAIAGTPATQCFGYIAPAAKGALQAQVARTKDLLKTLGAPAPLGPLPAVDDRMNLAADASGRCYAAWITFEKFGTKGELHAAVVEADGTAGPVEIVNDKPLMLGNDQITQGEDYLSVASDGTKPFITWVDLRASPQAAYVSWRGP